MFAKLARDLSSGLALEVVWHNLQVQQPGYLLFVAAKLIQPKACFSEHSLTVLNEVDGSVYISQTSIHHQLKSLFRMKSTAFEPNSFPSSAALLK